MHNLVHNLITFGLLNIKSSNGSKWLIFANEEDVSVWWGDVFIYYVVKGLLIASTPTLHLLSDFVISVCCERYILPHPLRPTPSIENVIYEQPLMCAMQ